MFARALRPAPEAVEVNYVPYGRHLDIAERLGTQALHGRAAEPFAGKSFEEMRALKEEYKRSVNPGGEVPSVRTASGDVITESEIVAEYFDMISTAPSARLVPTDPLQACRVRLAMKAFNDVVPGLFGLLSNQDPSKDNEFAEKIRGSLGKFAARIGDGDGFCVGAAPTLADVHCGPFLYRLSAALAHWRSFDLLENPRIASLLAKVSALPEFQSGFLSREEVVANYEFNAHGFRWTADGKSFGGRGRSLLGLGPLDGGLKLHYFPVRGRAEGLRMILWQAGAAYTDCLYSPEEWAKAKETMPEGQGVPGVCTRPKGNRGLPVLELATGELLPETADIARFVARHAPTAFPALAAEAAAEAHEMALAANCYPLMFPTCMLASYAEEQTEALLRGELPQTYHGNAADLPPYSEVMTALHAWSARLEAHGTPFFGGAAPHYGEFMLVNIVDSLRHVDPHSARGLSAALTAWCDRMFALPSVAGYLAERPGCGGPDAHGKPGSLITKYKEPSQREAVRAPA